MKIRLGSLFLLFLSACSPLPPAAPTQTPEIQDSNLEQGAERSDTPTPFQPEFPVPSETPAPNPTQATITIWVHPALAQVLPPVLMPAADPEEASLRLSPGGAGTFYAERVYALAAPFPTISDEISKADLIDWWESSQPALLLDATTASVFTALWGESGGSARIRSAEDLVENAWDSGDWAIILFEAIQPEWKVIAVEGQSPLSKEFIPDEYPLTARFTLQGEPGLVEAITALYGPQSPQPIVNPTNRDPNKLTTVVLTGVTALVRATAYAMEQQGVLYPARDIGDWLRAADILHISNEVPFAENCPFPDPVQASVVFCSDPDYLQLLEDIGTDVVELTGDHFHDWGAAAMLYTLDLYNQLGWPYYGGGANFEDGKQAALLEHNGNKFAFIGCNGKGGGFAQASVTNSGSVHCDFDWLHSETKRLTEAGYLVIATFQHFEYYTYEAPAAMWSDFRGMAESGAVIVSGSQAHHPHGFEFWDGALIHYGLGNLFFDQFGISPGTEQAFIDRHVFYDGHYLGVELLTTRFEDYARARPMTKAERQELLRLVFSASGW